MRPLTSGSIAVYDAIEEFYSLNGHSPGVPWICERVDFVKSTVAYHLNRLEQAGWIIREHKKVHAIIPVKYPRVHYVDRTVGLYATDPYNYDAITDDESGNNSGFLDGLSWVFADANAESNVRCSICNRYNCTDPHRDTSAQRISPMDYDADTCYADLDELARRINPDLDARR